MRYGTDEEVPGGRENEFNWGMLSLSCQWSVQETIGDVSVMVRCESGCIDMCFEGQ